jgi:hypothetical protein
VHFPWFAQASFHEWLDLRPSRSACEDQRLPGFIRRVLYKAMRPAARRVFGTIGMTRANTAATNEWPGRCARIDCMRPEHCIAPNAQDRQFEAAAPNQHWIAGLVRFPTDCSRPIDAAIGIGIKHAQTCSMTSNGSTIPDSSTQTWAISDSLSSNGGLRAKDHVPRYG